MVKKEPVLCYVSDNWLYFTTQDLDKQWGDDWDDAPYECNAGSPYEWRETDKKPKYEINKIASDLRGFETPDSFGSVSVRFINSRAVAWLTNIPWQPSGTPKAILIFAGTSLAETIRLLESGGATVYLPKEGEQQ